MALLTLLTDFGLADYYVGALKGTILRLAPGTTIVDLTHDVQPGAIDTAAFLLAAAAPPFPPGTLHLAVVDPDVGSERRILLARAAGSLYVAPDNGLLTPFLDQAEVWHADRPDLYLPGPSATFHGRDRFAPIAAALLSGEIPDSMGPRVTDARRLPAAPPSREGDGGLSGHVVHVDRFGNLVTDIPSSWLPDGPLRLQVGAHAVTRRADHYAAMAAGDPTIVAGSLGTAEISLRGESLSALWRVPRGTPVTIARARS
jgi:S-adenosylmethionine hydrolase